MKGRKSWYKMFTFLSALILISWKQLLLTCHFSIEMSCQNNDRWNDCHELVQFFFPLKDCNGWDYGHDDAVLFYLLKMYSTEITRVVKAACVWPWFMRMRVIEQGLARQVRTGPHTPHATALLTGIMLTACFSIRLLKNIDSLLATLSLLVWLSPTSSPTSTGWKR